MPKHNRPTSKLLNKPPIKAITDAKIGPKIGMIFSTPTIQPKAPLLGTPKIQNVRPEITPIIKHCKNVPLIKPAIT